MKTILLAGGFGTRLSEETEARPKPLVEIGGRPILWHIMKTFSHQGFTEFGVALGYKGEQIKDYFLRLLQLSDDLTVDIGTGRTELHATAEREPWKVHLANTGLHTMTGGRLERLQG
jgi:glucose-1-phosphate cytidylyltransferase